MSDQVREKNQTWNASGYVHHASFVAQYGAPLLDMLAPQKGERILDLGCGDGALTMDLAAIGCDVVGVDSSSSMIEMAKKRGLEAHVMNGHDLSFDTEFDGIMTNAALHWMLEPDAVLQGVAKALKPGGRFVGEFGGHGNVAALTTAIHASLEKIGIAPEPRNPWYFPTPDAYQKKLEAHGFTVQSINLIPRPTPLKTGVEGWLETFAKSFLHDLSREQQSDVLENTIRLLTPILCDEAGNWTADYVRLRFSTQKMSK